MLQTLIGLMLTKTPITPIPKQQLDDFLCQYGVQISDDYYDFLLNYGNSDFLTSDFADLRAKAFMQYYAEPENCDDNSLPNNHHYMGVDFHDMPLCKNMTDKEIYTFGYGRIDAKPYYGGLKELLFFSLLHHTFKYEYFDESILNIKIDDELAFKSKYLDYEIKNIHQHNRYFFKDGQLIVADDKFYAYECYRGGILNGIG